MIGLMGILRYCFTVVCFLIASVARAEDSPPTLPPPATTKIDFVQHIAPLLESHCAKCHARGQSKGSFSIETRGSILAGGDSGPAIVPGKSQESLLIELIAGVDPDRMMPEKGERLTPAQVGLFRAWIDQGATWPEKYTLGFRRAELALRRPELPSPAENASTHPIDRLLAPYYALHSIQSAPPVSDTLFARRVYLDLIGLLPSAEKLTAFSSDSAPDKRATLVKQLLGNRRAYADHWLTFWNDLLRNAYRGTGFIDGGRQPITPWLYRALYDNKPYDLFVRELVGAAPGTEGFTKGIVWRGVVNASQIPPVQAAQNVGQIFLGLNVKCASCHDSFVNYLKLSDSYALASVFSDAPLEIHRCDKPTGQKSKVAFFFPELGQIDAQAPRAQRMQQLATLLTKQENGRLARTIVNRLWLQLMGRALVEPVDDMDQPAWNPDLLDWLASDLVDHHYDLQHTLELICTSRAYQLPSVGAPKPGDKQFTFSGPIVKRMSAEQFVDSIARLTGVQPPEASDVVKPNKLIPESAEGAAPFRTSLTNDDPLTRALGRPNREQVVTRRESIATTLQALELTNGATLDAMLKGGAKKWLADSPKDPDQLATALYTVALGRKPTPPELEAACQLLTSPLTPAGVEDFLWSVMMLPEFQLIY